MTSLESSFLVEQVDLLDEILAASTDHIYVFDQVGRFWYASPAGLCALGLPAEELLGKNWRELNCPAAVMEWYDVQREAVFQTGISTKGETIFSTVQGQRHYEYVVSPILGADGEISGVISTSRDITDRKQTEAALCQLTEELEARVVARIEEVTALNQSLQIEIEKRQKTEQALQESEVRFQSLVEAVFEGIVIQENGKIMDANLGFAKMFGYSLEEVMGKSAADFLTPESVEVVLHHTAIHYEAPYEVTGIKKDGTYINLEVVGKQSLYQGRVVRVSAARDITDRKRTEVELRERERLFSTLAEALPVTIFRFDANSHCTYINNYWTTMTGRTVDSVMGLGWLETLHPEDRDRLASAWLEWSQDAQQRGLYQNEGRFVHLNGRDIWYYIQALPEVNENGETVGFIGVLNDITDRKCAEAELRRREELYRALASNFPNGAVHIFDHDLRYLLSDGTEMGKVGLSREQLEGHLLWEVVPSETNAVLEPLYRAALAGETTSAELSFADQIYQIYTLPLRNEADEIFAGLSMSQNVTLLKQAEQTLRTARDELERQVQERTQELQEANTLLAQREREFRTLVENTPDVITRHDRQYRCLYINPASMQSLGMPPEFFLGKKPSELGYPEDLANFWENSLENVFTKGEMRVDEFTALNGDKPRHYQVYVVPEREADQAIVSVVTIGRDITSLRQAEESTRKLAEELLRSNQELEQFAYIASHDLQEPLRAITSFTQLLAQEYQEQLDGDADMYIEFIVDGATRMQQLIRDLLTYSRVGRYELKLQPVNCNALLERVKQDLQVAIAENQAIITADPLPIITADPNQMANLLQNLISNSLKYRSKADPRIHITARNHTVESTHASSQDSSSHLIHSSEEWIFSLQDNGIGIEPQYAKRIFGIFQRLHTSDEYSGTGLGLAICQKIIERHQGRIWVESQLGQGATFFFTIPLSIRTHNDNPRSITHDPAR